MIKTLDRYIVRTFLNSVILCFVVLMAMRIVGDLSANLDEFTESDASAGVLIWTILRYYLFHSFVYFSELGGIIIVVGAAFAVFRMNHTNELTAMLASGVSLHRVVWPIILCSLIMGGLIVIDREFILPNGHIRPFLTRAADEQQVRGKFQIQFVADSDQSVWFSSEYDPNINTMYKPLVILRDPELRYLAHIIAQSAVPSVFEGHKGWMASDAEITCSGGPGRQIWRRTQNTDAVYTTIDPEFLTGIGKRRWMDENNQRTFPADKVIQKIPRLEAYDPEFKMNIRATMFIPAKPVLVEIPNEEGQPPIQKKMVLDGTLQGVQFEFKEGDAVLATIVADEAIWVPGLPTQCYWKLTNGRMFHSSNLTKDDLELRQSSRWMEFLSSGELTRLLSLPNVADPRSIRLTKYVRFADPLNNLVMLLLGLPFILSRERNLKASTALCLLMVGMFYVFIYLCRYMGMNDFLAAFLPVLIFGPVSVIMLDSVKT